MSSDFCQQLKTARGDVFKGKYKGLLKTKSRQILWMVSNCRERERNEYADKLLKHGAKLNKFGRCGRPIGCQRQKKEQYCERKIFSQYKFYLAFENSHCVDYITEKLWKCLYNGMVPIVMGPTLENYQKLLPPDSFLHVHNFSSPAKLAEYITHLDNNDEAYLKYHAWRQESEIVFTNYHQFLWVCDICKKIHDPPKPAYSNLSEYWRANVKCSNIQV